MSRSGSGQPHAACSPGATEKPGTATPSTASTTTAVGTDVQPATSHRSAGEHKRLQDVLRPGADTHRGTRVRSCGAARTGTGSCVITQRHDRRQRRSTALEAVGRTRRTSERQRPGRRRDLSSRGGRRAVVQPASGDVCASGSMSAVSTDRSPLDIQGSLLDAPRVVDLPLAIRLPGCSVGFPRGQPLPLLLEVVVFCVGAASLGAEIAAARLLAPWFGASTIVWANTIATVLVALSIGYAIGGRLADRNPTLPGWPAAWSRPRPCSRWCRSSAARSCGSRVKAVRRALAAACSSARWSASAC